MISFAFSPEQQDFRAQLLHFAQSELAPKYIERAATASFPWEAHRQLADLGILGIGLPEKYGGTDPADPITLGLATETLARGDINVAAGPIYVGLVAAQIAKHGQPSLAEEWVPQMIAGGGGDGRDRGHRAGGGVGRVQPEHRRAPGRRRLADHRREDRDQPRDDRRGGPRICA